MQLRACHYDVEEILGLENLEKELSKYLSDFSKMDVEWKCDNPL